LRFFPILLVMFLFIDDALSAESYFPALLPGSSQFVTENTSLPDLLFEKWGRRDWVNVVKKYQGATRYVTSCVELDAARQNGEYAPDTAGMGHEAERIEYCQNIRRLMLAKPALHNAFVFPLCLDMPLYLELGRALKSSWGSNGLIRIKQRFCGDTLSEAVVSYDRIIEPENELGGGLSDGFVQVRYLVQGDFDDDGWLDVIAQVAMHPDFRSGNWFDSESGVGGAVKISRVKGVLTVTIFEDL